MRGERRSAPLSEAIDDDKEFDRWYAIMVLARDRNNRADRHRRRTLSDTRRVVTLIAMLLSGRSGNRASPHRAEALVLEVLGESY
jgi:hypothetical protein